MKDRLWSSGLAVLSIFLLAWFFLHDRSLLEVMDDAGSFLSRLFGY